MANSPIVNEDPFKNLVGIENDLIHMLSICVDSE